MFSNHFRQIMLSKFYYKLLLLKKRRGTEEKQRYFLFQTMYEWKHLCMKTTKIFMKEVYAEICFQDIWFHFSVLNLLLDRDSSENGIFLQRGIPHMEKEDARTYGLCVNGVDGEKRGRQQCWESWHTEAEVASPGEKATDETVQRHVGHVVAPWIQTTQRVVPPVTWSGDELGFLRIFDWTMLNLNECIWKILEDNWLKRSFGSHV